MIMYMINLNIVILVKVTVALIQMTRGTAGVSYMRLSPGIVS